MTDIARDPVSRQIRIRYEEIEVAASGDIEFVESVGPAISPDGTLGRSERRVIAHMSDVVVIDAGGAWPLDDGIYEVTNNSLRWTGPLGDQPIQQPLYMDDPVYVPADASELMG